MRQNERSYNGKHRFFCSTTMETPPKTQTKKSVILDFNGTLFFDTDKNNASWHEVLNTVCSRKISMEEMSRYNIHGRANKAILEHFMERALSDSEAHRLSERKETIYRALCLEDREHFHLAEGVPAFLDHLKKERIPCTIATAAGKSNLDFYIEHFQLLRWFDADKIVYNDGTVRGKPEPDLYLRALARLNADGGSCLAVEDSPLGTLSARRAGIATVFAVSSSLGVSAFADTADAVIADFTSPALYEWAAQP